MGGDSTRIATPPAPTGSADAFAIVDAHQHFWDPTRNYYPWLNDEPPIAGGRELWGFPKKLAQPTLRTEVDTLVGTLDYGPLRVANGTMGYKHREADLSHVTASLEAPNFLLKIIPHVDGSPRICELVEYYLEDIALHGAWTGPGALDLHAHALAPVADLPVLEVVSTMHFIADLTLGLGNVVHDYLR